MRTKTAKHSTKLLAFLLSVLLLVSLLPAGAFAADEKGYLSELRLTRLQSTDELTLTPAFNAATHDYVVSLPDQSGSAYVAATLSEDAPAGSTIKAEWTNLYNNKTSTSMLTSGKLAGQYMANFGRDGKTNTLTVTVGTASDQQVYTVTSKRTPSLSGISATDSHMNESFVASTYAYTAETTASSITVNATPYKEDYTVTYNGGSENTFDMNIGENTIVIAVSNGTDTQNYTLVVTRHEIRELSITTTPATAVVNLVDPYGERVMAKENGKYDIGIGYEYTLTVSEKGYVGQQEKFTAAAETTEKSVTLVAAKENSKIDTTISADWGNFRKGDNNLGITSSKVPYDPDEVELLWAEKYGTGWAAAPGSPILVDGDVFTYVGSTIKRLDADTGKVLAENTMVAASSFSIVPPTYANGMIFVGLSGGRVQAFNAKTLESLWVYTDPLGGQPNCAPTYKDGYIYIGFWNSEIKNANFVAISVTDENPDETTEAKYASWSYQRAGGFYWAGAYAGEKYVVVGTDNGKSDCTTESASLLVFERATGKLVDSWDGIRGDIRSNVSYDPDSDRVFFTSKGGVLCNAKIDWNTGKILDKQCIVITDANGTEYVMSTCTPSVYNGRIYIGTAGNGGNFEGKGFSIGVYDLNADGTMTKAYAYAIAGYPQTSAMVCTAYADEQNGYVYIYLPYNAQPGGISVLKDKKGQTAPLTVTDEGYSEIFTPVSPLNQYCICSAVADSYGTIYYKNDSCYMMALTSKIESIKVTKQPTSVTKQDDGSYKAEGMKVVANLANGLQRDITNYVTVSKSNDVTMVKYTYGLDHANYGLKTKKTVLLPGDVNGDGLVDWEDGSIALGYFLADEENAGLTEEQIAAADVNGDGIVDNVDALLIYQYDNSMIDSFPVEQ